VTLFRLDASIRTEGSHSRQIADIVQRVWRQAHPNDQVISREIGISPLPSDAWATAAIAAYTPEEQRSPEQRAAVALAGTLTDELEAADALIFAVPLYNFGVSQRRAAGICLAHERYPRRHAPRRASFHGRRTGCLVGIPGCPLGAHP
jgi:FMN-dependent NADH-azoreductase